MAGPLLKSRRRPWQYMLRRRLKLSQLSVGSRRLSLSGSVSKAYWVQGSWAGNSKCPTPIRAETQTVSRHNEVMTPGRTKMLSTGHHIRGWNAVVHQVTGSLVMKADTVMHLAPSTSTGISKPTCTPADLAVMYSTYTDITRSLNRPTLLCGPS